MGKTSFKNCIVAELLTHRMLSEGKYYELVEYPGYNSYNGTIIYVCRHKDIIGIIVHNPNNDCWTYLCETDTNLSKMKFRLVEHGEITIKW